MKRDYWVDVCNECLTASCWHGVFMCQRSDLANVIRMKASELRLLKKEHRNNYSQKRLREVCGDIDFVANGPAKCTTGE